MKKLAIGLLTVLSLAACSNVTKEKLGIAQKAPNEFMVAPKAPLSLPPEYDLRPVSDMQGEQAENTNLDTDEEGLLDKINSK